MQFIGDDGLDDFFIEIDFWCWMFKIDGCSVHFRILLESFVNGCKIRFGAGAGCLHPDK
jgi:predicted acetyltransferase